MDARYSRNIPALSEDECALLKQKRVLIIGCGGLGGYLLDMMLRIGVGHIRICDGDIFEPTNLNRQLLSGIPQLGCSKVCAAASHSNQVNPDVVMEPVNSYMTQDNVFDLIDQCDAVLDALDNIESRKILSLACEQTGTPYIWGAVSGWIAQAAVSMPGDGLIEKLYPEDPVIQEKSVLSFTPALCASVQAALCIKLLTGRHTENSKIYYFDLLNQEFSSIPVI